MAADATPALLKVAAVARGRDQIAAAHRAEAKRADAILRRVIREARAAGATVGAIAEAVGKSRPWVYYYLNEGGNDE